MPRLFGEHSSRAAVRIFTCLLGAASVAWGVFFLPALQQQAALNKTSSEILLGHSFKREVLLDEVQRAEPAEHDRLCNPATLHDLVVLRLAITEDAIAQAKPELLEPAYESLSGSIRNALSCAPSDPFVWLALFWLETREHGWSAENERYLRLSYTLGPNEGWVALWRAKIAFAFFDQLPADLQDDALGDFIKLLNTQRLYPETAAIFASATRPARNRIIERLKDAEATPREFFARALYDKGLNVHIPDTEIPGLRPWER